GTSPGRRAPFIDHLENWRLNLVVVSCATRIGTTLVDHGLIQIASDGERYGGQTPSEGLHLVSASCGSCRVFPGALAAGFPGVDTPPGLDARARSEAIGAAASAYLCCRCLWFATRDGRPHRQRSGALSVGQAVDRCREIQHREKPRSTASGREGLAYLRGSARTVAACSAGCSGRRLLDSTGTLVGVRGLGSQKHPWPAARNGKRGQIDPAGAGGARCFAGEPCQQRDRQSTEYLRTHREVPRLQSPQRVWREAPSRPHSPLLPKAEVFSQRLTGAREFLCGRGVDDGPLDSSRSPSLR